MQHIYIGDEGKGFPLILIHGFLGSSKMWEPQISFFKNHITGLILFNRILNIFLNIFLYVF